VSRQSPFNCYISAPQQSQSKKNKLTKRFSKEFSPHLPTNGAQKLAKHANGAANLSSADFMMTPSAGVAG